MTGKLKIFMFAFVIHDHAHANKGKTEQIHVGHGAIFAFHARTHIQPTAYPGPEAGQGRARTGAGEGADLDRGGRGLGQFGRRSAGGVKLHPNAPTTPQPGRRCIRAESN